MALLLRKVKHNRWNEATQDITRPLPADPLADLSTEKNALSLWELLPNKTDLPDIITGVAATFFRLQNVDYVLIDQQRIEQLGVSVYPTPGGTPLKDVRDKHRDARPFQATTLIDLAELIRAGGEFGFATEDEVGTFLAQAIAQGRLRVSSLGDKMREDLTKKGFL